MGKAQKMKCFLDTNVLLDFFIEHRRLQNPDVERLMNKVFSKKIKATILSISLLNFEYLMKGPYKIANTEVRKMLNVLLNQLEVASLSQLDYKLALSLKWNDFEDSCQFVAAQKYKSEIIITNDTKGFKKSTLSVLTAKQFCTKYIAK